MISMEDCDEIAAALGKRVHVAFLVQNIESEDDAIKSKHSSLLNFIDIIDICLQPATHYVKPNLREITKRGRNFRLNPLGVRSNHH